MILWTKHSAAAIIVSVLFEIHPLHVESVSWVSALNDVLYGCFSLLALISYTKYLQKGRTNKYLIITAIWFITTCLSKTLAIILSAIFLLLNRDFTASMSQMNELSQKIPFLLIRLLFAYVSLWAKNEMSSKISNITNLYGFSDRVFFAFYGIQFYFTKLLLPFGLSAFHAFPLKTRGSLPTQLYSSPVFTLILIAILYFAKLFRKELIFGFLFFFINIALVIQIISFGETVIAERYTYILYIGLFFCSFSFQPNSNLGKQLNNV
jgi:hypothetical protein